MVLKYFVFDTLQSLVSSVSLCIGRIFQQLIMEIVLNIFVNF